MSENYYGDQGLDLRYPELAYNKAPIHRANPGVVPFYIPALYPYTADGKPKTNTTVQKDSNIKNKDKNVPVSNVNISNCINITVPKEICGFIDGGAKYVGGMHIEASGKFDHQSTHDYDLNIEMAGGPSPHVHPGKVTVGAVTESGDINMTAGDGGISGHFKITMDDSTIPVDSAWVVVFIGGDISKPMIISRCYP